MGVRVPPGAQHATAPLGVPFAVSASFEAAFRHSSSVAEQARGRALLVHELDEAAGRQPEWWRLRRGEAAAGEIVTRTAANVADDLHALTTQLVTRLNDRENQEASA